MSKRLMWIGGILALLVVAGFGWMKLHERPEWTTASPAALAEYEAGLAADMKLYQADAQRHYEKALELDPDFVMAKLQVAMSKYGRRKELLDELHDADLSRLTDRERFLVRFYLARADDKRDEAAQILERYLTAHPDDTFALGLAAARAWSAHDMEQAETLYRRLLAVSPNYVLAYNQLGYTAMLRGQFDKAEEYLSTYRYIAPDQANPHDSLGELYTLTGRYGEAVRELDAAIRVKPDFWLTYQHLMVVHLLEGDPDAAGAAVDRAVAAGVDKKMAHEMECTVAVWRAMGTSWDAVWRETSGPCNDIPNGIVALAGQRAALAEGHDEAARKLEEAAREADAKMQQSSHGSKEPDANVAHMEGVRLLAENEPAEAAERFRAADRSLSYLGNGEGIFKLFNRLALATALQRAGRSDAAAETVAEVRAVNPELARQYEAGEIHLLSAP